MNPLINTILGSWITTSTGKPVMEIKSADDPNCFGMDVARDDQNVEIVIEITGYHPGDARSYYGCERDYGYIEIEAWTLDGKSFDLTPEEDNEAKDAALRYILKQASEADL